ncbi:MAG: sugar phosphate nucleotidyltransferase [Terriglobia bacterium]
MMDGMAVVILCGGKGTRSYPFTEYFPKVMMPVNGTPILVHLMRIYAAQGFERFVLCAGHRKELLYDYFDGRFQNWQVEIVDTGEDSDTGERIRRCADYVGDTFFATYGDGLGNLDMHSLLEFHQRHGSIATVTTVPLRSQYGRVVSGLSGQVTHFEEKPVVDDHWINAGFFVFERSVFDRWEGTNLESHALPALARQGVLYSYMHRGFWKSMDTSKDQQEMERLYKSGTPPWAVGDGPVLCQPEGDERRRERHVG